MAFKLQSFISSCLAVINDADAHKQITALLAKVVADPDSIYAEIGRPEKAQIEKLYVSDELTVVNVVWAPKMTLLPHNHNMWASIGVYCGREDNILWRRLKDEPNRIEAAGAKTIGPTEVQPLGANIIHSVTNPTSAFTAAIHVYGGNFFENERSEWEPSSLTEQPYDVVKNLSLFEQENAILQFLKGN